jgi:hypothetical protein
MVTPIEQYMKPVQPVGFDYLPKFYHNVYSIMSDIAVKFLGATRNIQFCSCMSHSAELFCFSEKELFLVAAATAAIYDHGMSFNESVKGTLGLTPL